MRVGAVTIHAISAVNANAEDEIRRLLMRAHGEMNGHRIAGLEDVGYFALCGRERDAGDFDLARAPAAFVSARHVFESGGPGLRTLDLGLGFSFVSSALLRTLFGARELFLFAVAN